MLVRFEICNPKLLSTWKDWVKFEASYWGINSSWVWKGFSFYNIKESFKVFMGRSFIFSYNLIVPSEIRSCFNTLKIVYFIRSILLNQRFNGLTTAKVDLYRLFKRKWYFRYYFAAASCYLRLIEAFFSHWNQIIFILGPYNLEKLSLSLN